MPRLALAVAVALTACTPAVRSPVLSDAPPSAAELVRRVDEAYATAATYIDHGELVALFTGPNPHTVRVSFETMFRREGGLRFAFEGNAVRRSAVVVWSANNRDAVTHSYRDPGGAPTSPIASALVGASGESHGVADGAPLALVVPGHSVLGTGAAARAIVVSDVVNDIPCWRLTVPREHHNPSVWWIDQRTSLVIRHVSTNHITKETMERLAAQRSDPSLASGEPFDTTTTTTYRPARDVELSRAQLADLATDLTVLPREVWIGVTLVRGGHAIDRVLPTSPADAAGIVSGDELDAIEGKPISNLRDLHAAIADRQPGARVVARVRRNGVVLELPIVLAAKPMLGDLARGLVGKPAPDFALATTTGADVSLAALRGKVIVLDFWATWCIPCEVTTPIVNALAAKHPSAAVIGLSSEDAGTIAKSTGHAYTLALDPDDRVASAYLVQGIPQFVVIDQQGIVRHVGGSIAGARALDAVVAKLEHAP